ncbi:MAG TPA: ATP-binding protein [Candidatus Dormibacteraeota bacterium]|nr:ATP-binding protein [Candidatus Dormibacteraeota bacterium]
MRPTVDARRFASVFSALSDGVLMTDERAVVTEANPAAHRLLRRATLVGTPLVQLLPPGRAELVDRAVDHVVRRWRMPTEETEVVLEVVTSHTLGDAGEAVGAVHTIRDVTANAQLMRLKEEFLFAVAHELRTPVSALTASLDLLHHDLTTMSPAELRAMVATLRRSALRLEAFVENLLDIGSIQAGTFEVRAVASSLRRCLREAVFQAQPLTSARGQTVRARIPREHDRILADPRRTAQVLANLIANASKYSPERTDIAIESAEEDGFIRVSVRDEGPGITPAERERVFDRFYRSRITSDGASGIGLGLSICRAIVEAQGGHIAIDDAPGGGARVQFTIPRPRIEEEDA